MTSSDAADQAINLTLKGIEIAAKISGAGAKNLAVYLYAVLNDQKRTKGKTRLKSMLKDGRSLKVFSVKKDDLPIFVREAKRYGILYAALKDKKDLDGMCDIMVRSEDGAKINRIIERFHLASLDIADIKTEILHEKAEDSPEKKSATSPEKKNPSKSSYQPGASDKKKDSVKETLTEIKENLQKNTPCKNNQTKGR